MLYFFFFSVTNFLECIEFDWNGWFSTLYGFPGAVYKFLSCRGNSIVVQHCEHLLSMQEHTLKPRAILTFTY